MMYQQGSIMWLREKLGKISGSNIHKLMGNAKKKGELSATAKTYCDELVCDIVYGEPEEETFTSRDMERGLELEPCAIEAFCEYMEKKNPMNPVTVEEVGFITHPDNPKLGVSLDGKVSDGGILEIKCRKRKGHLTQFKIIAKIRKMIKDKEEVIITAAEKLVIAHYQRQWGMYCTGSTHSYFVGYTDELDMDKGALIVHRFERDQELIDEMEVKAEKALKYISEKVIEYKELIEENK